jgi:protein-S-isoprenylcysteine O-methyltransferase Ste14
MGIVMYLIYGVCILYIIYWLVGSIKRKEKHEIVMAVGAWLFISLCFESFGSLSRLEYWQIESPSYLKIIAMVFLVSAGLIFLISSQTMRRKGNPEKGWEHTTELVETGIFGLVRHPIYLSSLFAIVGVCLHKISLVSIVVTPIGGVLFFLAAWYEDAYNEKKFGDVYREYRKKTKLFVPFIY